MKTTIVNHQLNCDVCGAQNCDEVYDAPSGGRWGYFCSTCASQYVNLHGMGTHLKRPQAEPGWRDQFPNLANCIREATRFVDDYGQTYVDALEDSWCMYGKEGLQKQLLYIAGNMETPNVTAMNVKTTLKRMAKEGLS